MIGTAEYSSSSDDPFYPVLTNQNKVMYDKYKNESEKFKSISFLGRLAEYKYYNMDQVVAKIIKLFN